MPALSAVASVPWFPISSPADLGTADRLWSDLVIAGCVYEIAALLSKRTGRVPDLPSVSELVVRAKRHKWGRFAGFVWDLVWDVHFWSQVAEPYPSTEGVNR